MNVRIDELRSRQVVCMKDGCVLGTVSDVELDISDGRLVALVIYGRPRLMGLLGNANDIVIPRNEISVLGKETILVTTDPAPYLHNSKHKKWL